MRSAEAPREKERYEGRRRRPMPSAGRKRLLIWLTVGALIVGANIVWTQFPGVFGKHRSDTANTETPSGDPTDPYSGSEWWDQPLTAEEPNLVAETSPTAAPPTTHRTETADRRSGGGTAPEPAETTTGPQPSASPTPSIQSVAGWTGRIINVSHSRCLDIPANDPYRGARLQITDCSGNPAQIWTFGEDRSLRARGMCLEVRGGSTSSGAAIQLGRCSGAAAQQFNLTTSGGLVNPRADKCVSVVGGDGAGDGALLETMVCNGRAYQRWERDL